MKSEKKKKSGGILETLRTLVYAILIAVIIRTVAYEPFNIPSGSMIPTLLVGDYLFVSKFSYGFSRFSLPMSPPIFNGRIFKSNPKRGDVAVFKLPRDNSTDFIKRVIGLPGDEIQVKNGIVLINSEPIIRKKLEDFIYFDSNGNKNKIPKYEETLPNGVSYITLDSDPSSIADNTPIYKVRPDHVFMMGDNRDDSTDSRFSQVGQVPIENLVGRAEILFFSINNWKIKFQRILKKIR